MGGPGGWGSPGGSRAVLGRSWWFPGVPAAGGGSGGSRQLGVLGGPGWFPGLGGVREHPGGGGGCPRELEGRRLGGRVCREGGCKEPGGCETWGERWEKRGGRSRGGEGARGATGRRGSRLPLLPTPRRKVRGALPGTASAADGERLDQPGSRAGRQRQPDPGQDAPAAPGAAGGHHPAGAAHLRGGHRGQRDGGAGGAAHQAHGDPHQLLPGEPGGG